VNSWPTFHSDVPHRTSAAIHDETCDIDLLTRPAQLNVLADHFETNDALPYLRTAAESTEFYQLSLAESILEMATGVSIDRIPDYELGACIQNRNNWTDQIFDTARLANSDRCVFVQGIQSSFLESPGSISLKVTLRLAHQWNTLQAISFRIQNQNTTMVSDGRVNLSHSSGRKAIHYY
jgi:hypothetical protein